MYRQPHKGRGAISNREGRYESTAKIAEDDGWTPPEAPGAPATEIREDVARRVITTNDSPDVPFDQSVNPYRGCEHGCIYCYARPGHAWLGLSPGLDFETKLYVKRDAAARLKDELAAPGYRCRVLAMGTYWLARNTPSFAPDAPGLPPTHEPDYFLRGESRRHFIQHDADFINRHKLVAAADSQFCANCHKEDFCVACHDGRVRPRSIHPNDYLGMHATEARLAMQRCTSCHREQSFCLGCHQRVGVSMSGPRDVREAGRFHPPKSEWSDAPRRPGHHGFEAMRNLNACVSCHIERDCVVCHGGQGIGGGFNPHQGNFRSSCGTQFRRNPRPCYVCHEPGAPSLEECR